MNLKTFFQIGILKTIRFNVKYFGWKSLFRPKVILAKQVQILELGGTVKFEKDVEHLKGLVWFGFHDVGILDKKYERAIWQNSGNVVFSGRAALASGVRISNRGQLKIGNGVNITGNTSIVCHKAVIIGADCMISWDSLIMDMDFHDLYRMEDGEEHPINPPEEIQIGEHCWICCRCLVLKGVKLPPDTVVAAGSTISAHEFSEEHTIIGNNHWVLKRQIGWRK